MAARVSGTRRAGGLDQEGQVEARERRGAGRHMNIREPSAHEEWNGQLIGEGHRHYQLWASMDRRFGYVEILAARKSSLTAIVGIRRGDALSLLATVGRLLRKLAAAEAIERLQEQQDRDETDPDVNASAH